MTGAFSIGWLVDALIASTLLMAFVLAVRKPAQRVLGPQLSYWLWALPALRMALPPLPTGWRGAASPITAASGTVLVYIDRPATVAAAGAAPSAPSLLAVIAALWIAGGIGFFVWHGLSHVAFVRRILRPPARHQRMADGTTLVESDAASGPVAFGVLKRFVAVPSDFAERYAADERKLALAHELGHHARGDLIANWIALAVLAAHWFNPIAWIAYRRFRADQEAANDARVLASLRPIERHAYACAIVKAAHGRAVAAACHLHTIEDLKRRLTMLKASRKSRRVLMAGAMGITGLTVAGLGLTASGAAAEKIRAVAAPRAVAALTPAVAVAQDAPEAPPAAGDRQRRVVIVRDGKRVEYVGPAADAYVAAHPEMAPPVPPAPPRAMAAPLAPLAPAAPTATITVDGKPLAADTVVVDRDDARDVRFVADSIRTEDCSDGVDGKQYVVHRAENGHDLLVICTNRIERVAAEAAAQAGSAKDIERRAYTQALAGLRASRERMLRKSDMAGWERKEALSAIDESIAEIEGDLAHLD